MFPGTRLYGPGFRLFPTFFENRRAASRFQDGGCHESKPQLDLKISVHIHPQSTIREYRSSQNPDCLLFKKLLLFINVRTQQFYFSASPCLGPADRFFAALGVCHWFSGNRLVASLMKEGQRRLIFVNGLCFLNKIQAICE